MASSLSPRRGVLQARYFSLAWMPVRLHLHLSMLRRQDFANGMVQPVRRDATQCPSERPGATRSRMSCSISLISGKRPRSFRDQMTSSSMRTSKMPPVLIRGERHGAELVGKRGQELLRHPAGPQAPAAQPAIGDLDHGADGHIAKKIAKNKRCYGNTPYDPR